MSLTWTYSHPTTPAGAGTAIAITTAVQVSAEHRLTAAASVGDTSVVGIKVEDPEAVYDFKGLWRLYVIESACDSGDHYAWNGYVGKQTISRGAGTDVMYPVGTGRRWDLELSELSSLAGFRVISGDDGNRSAETVDARVAWLIGTAVTYLPVFDNGLIASDTTALDANDYRGQYANDVLNDMAVMIGFNWWIYYDQSAATDEELSLAFFDPNSSLYSSTIKISNVKADVDSSTVFAPYEDGSVERDPQKIAAGVYLPYSGGAVYEYDYDTSYAFAFRDQVAPTASVKTSAKAIALADRFLDENRDQDERANVTIRLPKAQLNDVKHGHRIQVKLQHVPGWEDYRWCRVIRKTFAPPANRTQSFYDVDLELAPIREQPQAAFAAYATGSPGSGIPTLPAATTPGRVLLLAVQGGSNSAEAPPLAAPTLVDDPDTTATAGAWTTLAHDYTSAAGQSILGPAAGFAMSATWFWRYVQTGEVTTRPVQVSSAVSPGYAGAWLYELPTTLAPTAGTGYHTTVGVPPHVPADYSLPSTSGNAVGLLVWVFSDTGGENADVTEVAGTTVSSTQGNNNPVDTTTTGWAAPWVWIGQLSSGGVITVNMDSTITGYRSGGLAACGATCTLPTGIVLPNIPYPANQT